MFQIHQILFEHPFKIKKRTLEKKIFQIVFFLDKLFVFEMEQLIQVYLMIFVIL